MRTCLQLIILLLLVGGISCGFKLGHEQKQEQELKQNPQINGSNNSQSNEQNSQQKSVVNEIWPWIVLVSVVFVGQIGLIWINWVTRYSKEKQKYERGTS